MGIYIKDLAMPEHCGECLSYHYLFGRDICWAGKGRRIELLPNKRPDWCPLLEVKPHGRLIDADEVKYHLRDEKMRVSKLAVMACINNSATIIPKEKGEK